MGSRLIRHLFILAWVVGAQLIPSVGRMVCGEEENVFLKKLAGTWIVLSIDDGKQVQKLNGFKMEITKESIILEAPNGAKKTMGDISRIDGQVRPGQIDLRKGNAKGFGIFELDGDYLKLIVCDPGQERPTVFKGTPTGLLFTLKRERR